MLRRDVLMIGAAALAARVGTSRPAGAAVTTANVGKADILKILGNNGAAKAVEALLENVDRLKNMLKSKVLAAASVTGADFRAVSSAQRR